jgi:RNA-binding protein
MTIGAAAVSARAAAAKASRRMQQSCTKSGTIKPMPPTLTARERAGLKARAHKLEPVVQLGSSGVTDGVAVEVDRALTAHELIKVKITGEREERVAVGDDLCARTGAVAVHRVGKILILWRPRPADAS